MGADPLTMGLMAAGTGMSVLGSIQQGQDAKGWGKYQQKQAKADAFAQIGSARVEQQKIREATEQQRSSATAAIAGTGVVVGDGTASDIEKRITERGRWDEEMTYYNALDQANRILAEGQAARIQGDEKAQASYMQGVGSLLGGAVGMKTAYDKWKTSTTTQTPSWITTGLNNTPFGQQMKIGG